MKKNTPHSQKVLNLWGIILIIWAFYRLKIKMPEWFDELLAKPIIFVLPVYHFIKKVENKKFLPSLNWSFKSFKKDILLSLLISFVFLLTIFSANLIKSGKINLISKNITSSDFLYVFIISLVGAACEQVLSTGFVFERLYIESKNFYQTAFFSAILFFFLHIPLRFTIPNLVGSQLVFMMLIDIFLSLINFYFYLTYKSLNLPILIHAFYNLIVFLMI